MKAGCPPFSEVSTGAQTLIVTPLTMANVVIAYRIVGMKIISLFFRFVYQINKILKKLYIFNKKTHTKKTCKTIPYNISLFIYQ